MAGASLQVDLNGRTEVLVIFDHLVAAGEDPKPLLLDLAEYLLEAQRRHFDEQAAPDGTPWAPLTPKYRRRKRKNKDKILVLDDLLRSTLHYQIEGNEIAVGSNLIYGATHQFGDDSRGIPARPFLGVNDANLLELYDRAGEYLDRLLRP